MSYWDILEEERSLNNKLYSMSYNFLTSRTFWTSVLLFAFNGFAAISAAVPAAWSMPINFVLGALITYFHVSAVNKAQGIQQ